VRQRAGELCAMKPGPIPGGNMAHDTATRGDRGGELDDDSRPVSRPLDIAHNTLLQVFARVGLLPRDDWRRSGLPRGSGRILFRPGDPSRPVSAHCPAERRAAWLRRTRTRKRPGATLMTSTDARTRQHIRRTRRHSRPALEGLERRALMDGNPDPSFDGDGFVITHVGPSTETSLAQDLALYPASGTADSKIVAVGTAASHVVKGGQDL